jgi:hypothetical protein
VTSKAPRGVPFSSTITNPRPGFFVEIGTCARARTEVAKRAVTAKTSGGGNVFGRQKDFSRVSAGADCQSVAGYQPAPRFSWVEGYFQCLFGGYELESAVWALCFVRDFQSKAGEVGSHPQRHPSVFRPAVADGFGRMVEYGGAVHYRAVNATRGGFREAVVVQNQALTIRIAAGDE